MSRNCIRSICLGLYILLSIAYSGHAADEAARARKQRLANELRAREAGITVEAVRKQRLAAEARADKARTAADKFDLKSKWWPNGSALDLQKREAKDIEKIQIFRLEWPKGGFSPDTKERHPKKQYATRPLMHDEDTQEIEGLLTLLKRANKKPAPGVMYESYVPDLALVVKPVGKQPFQILFSSELRHEPFGEVYSLELKEVLYALVNGSNFTVIHLDKGEVNRVFHHRTPSPLLDGGFTSRDVKAEMHLSVERGLTLYVRVRDGRKTLMEDEKALHYGEAKVFKSSGPGSYIVLLQKP